MGRSGRGPRERWAPGLRRVSWLRRVSSLRWMAPRWVDRAPRTSRASPVLRREEERLPSRSALPCARARWEPARSSRDRRPSARCDLGRCARSSRIRERCARSCSCRGRPVRERCACGRASPVRRDLVSGRSASGRSSRGRRLPFSRCLECPVRSRCDRESASRVPRVRFVLERPSTSRSRARPPRGLSPCGRARRASGRCFRARSASGCRVRERSSPAPRLPGRCIRVPCLCSLSSIAWILRHMPRPRHGRPHAVGPFGRMRGR